MTAHELKKLHEGEQTSYEDEHTKYIYIYICVSKKRHSREHILPWMKFYFSIDVTNSMFEVKEGLDLRNDSRHLCFHEFLEKFLTNTSKRDSIQNHRLKMLSCFKHHLVTYIEYISIQLKVSWKQYHEKLSTGVKHEKLINFSISFKNIS